MLFINSTYYFFLLHSMIYGSRVTWMNVMNIRRLSMELKFLLLSFATHSWLFAMSGRKKQSVNWAINKKSEVSVSFRVKTYFSTATVYFTKKNIYFIYSQQKLFFFIYDNLMMRQNMFQRANFPSLIVFCWWDKTTYLCCLRMSKNIL
jgi:hypothetical protein